MTARDHREALREAARATGDSPRGPAAHEPTPPEELIDDLGDPTPDENEDLLDSTTEARVILESEGLLDDEEDE